MASCREIHGWTFCGLVGAFLDLLIAYFLLCGATAAFLAAKLLGVFGLQLPCPCQGLFGHPNGRCLQGILSGDPPRKIACVQVSVRSRFPFDSIFAEEDRDHCCHDGEVVERARGGVQCGRILDMGREEAESCGSASNLNAASSHNQVIASDVRNKGVLNGVKPRLGLKRRRLRAAAELRKSSHVLPSGQGPQHSPYCMRGQKDREIPGGNNTAVYSGDHHLFTGSMESSGGIGVDEEDNCNIESSQQLTRRKAVEEESVIGTREVIELDTNEDTTIRTLEQALEEEQAARSAVYLELEKERSAAATAADEAMAMILRLQKEKALIEMEARQYQRMVEEKAAYDEEEMNILKEIIVRRERENHVLEKEFELYRQMILSEDGSQKQPSDDFHNKIHITGQQPKFSFEFADEQDVMLRRLSENITEKETPNDDNGHPGNNLLIAYAAGDDNGPHDCVGDDSGIQCASQFIKAEQHGLGGYGNDQTCCRLVEDICYLRPANDKNSGSLNSHRLNMLEAFGESHLDFQEEGMLAVDLHTSPRQSQTSGHGDDLGIYKMTRSQENICHNEASISLKKVGENGCEIADRFSCGGINQVNQQDAGERGCKSYAPILEAEPGVLDVHVIDDKSHKEGNNDVDEFYQVSSEYISSRARDSMSEQNGSKKFDVSRNYPSSNWLEAKQNIRRSISDFRGVPLPAGTSCDNFSVSELRRNSMSAVDKERLKLETEVELLRERLKIVQEGRDKLNFSMDHKEENLQLQLLEEIATQLREIRQLSNPGKAIRRQVSLTPSSSTVQRQVSLTPPSSKANLKKRQWRSFSWSVHGSM